MVPMRQLGPLALLASLFLAMLGCARPDAHTTPVDGRADARADHPELPTPASFAPDGATVFLRFDTARMRGLPYERELATIVSSAPTWERLGYGSESDPIRDVDTMLCFSVPVNVSSQGILASRWTFVLRHPHDDVTVKRRLEGMGRSSDRPIAWTVRDGFDTAPLPVPPSGFSEHGIVVTAPHEVVVAPVDEIERIIYRARQHATLRSAGVSVVDPSLEPTTPDELAFIDIRTRDADTATIMMPDGTESPRIDHFRLVLRYVDSNLVGDADLEFANEPAAVATQDAIGRALASIDASRVGRMFGVTRLTRSLRMERLGSRLHFGFALDSELASLALSLAALASD